MHENFRTTPPMGGVNNLDVGLGQATQWWGGSYASPGALSRIQTTGLHSYGDTTRCATVWSHSFGRIVTESKLLVGADVSGLTESRFYPISGGTNRTTFDARIQRNFFAHR